MGKCRELEVSSICSWITTVSKIVREGEREAHTLFSHAPQMRREPAFIFAEWFIALFMRLDPITNVCPELEMMCGCSMKLIRQGAKKAVAVSQRGCGIQSKRA